MSFHGKIVFPHTTDSPHSPCRGSWRWCSQSDLNTKAKSNTEDLAEASSYRETIKQILLFIIIINIFFIFIFFPFFSTKATATATAKAKATAYLKFMWPLWQRVSACNMGCNLIKKMTSTFACFIVFGVIGDFLRSVCSIQRIFLISA